MTTSDPSDASAPAAVSRRARALPWILAIGFAAFYAALALVFDVLPRIGQDPYGHFDLAVSLASGRGFACRAR